MRPTLGTIIFHIIIIIIIIIHDPPNAAAIELAARESPLSIANARLEFPLRESAIEF